MEVEEHETPQKVKSTTLLWANIRSQGRKSSIGSGNATPKCSSNKKGLHPRTPNGKISTSVSCSSFHIFPTSTVCSTPPAKRFHRVRNPFEAAWADRLHLPVISSSPSLFQPPVAPHLSSTVFEWTIDEVSSLKPANVEPHETQFQDSPDPDAETKAQSAISSYFKEQQIVPSPVDCPLRSHRIILSELNGNTPLSKPGRRIRDCGTQTELTLPAILPKALEDALRPYFQPHLAAASGRGGYAADNDDYHQLACSSGGSSEAKDISLRRKLFDMHNIIVLDNESKSPKQAAKVSSAKSSSSNSSPLSVTSMLQQQQQQHHTVIVGKLSDSLDKSSFGSLSPISASDGLSPQHGSATKRKSRLHNFLDDLDELGALSPIHPPARSVFTRRKSLKSSINAVISTENYRTTEANTTSEQTFADISMAGSVAVNQGKFTPDRSSSPLNCLENAELSIDSSFNIKVSRLMVNSSKCSTVRVEQQSSTKQSADMVPSELSMHLDDTADILDGDDDDDMQVSHLSAQSSNCSSNSDTPRSKRRSASRKNLSQSFSLNWLETEEEEQKRDDDNNAIEENGQLAKIPLPKLTELILEQQQQAVGKTEQKLSPEERSVFYRTDSGFNEMSSSSSSTQLIHQSDELSRDGKVVAELPPDVSMLVCCSTPSKHGQGESSGVASAAF